MQFNNLPVYEGKIVDNEDGMLCISLVDEPATESNFVAFSSEKENIQFSIANEEQRMVFGLIMGANQPIYRRDKSGYEYYIIYRPETLRVMAEKYLKDGYQNNVDRMHDFNPVGGVNMVQIFIKDTEKGISPKGFEEFEDGSLFGQFHVVNDEVWEQIKDGTFKGFSLAGIFEKEQTFNKEHKNIIAMKIEKIKAVLRKLLAEFGSISTDKGVIVWDGDDDLKEETPVRGMDEEGNETELEDGEYLTEDKKVITIENGIVVSIVDSEAEVAPENEPEEEPKENEEPEETPEEEPKEEPAEEPAQEEEPAEEEAPATDEKDEKIANLEGEVASLKEENEALKARIKELEGESAAEPANEQFKKAEEKNSKVSAMERRGYKF